MTRLSFEGGRWLALCSLCACTSGLVLDSSESSAAPERDVPVLQPTAAASAGHSAVTMQPMAADAAGGEALGMRVVQPPPPPPQGGAEAQLPRALPEHMFGVTVTDDSPLDSITDALRNLKHKPTTRVVFDLRRQALSYVPALQEIHGVSFVMGELVDSVSVVHTSIDLYAARTTDYLNELSDVVDIWEVGNDVNGAWLGPPEKVAAKISAAYALVKERDKRTALTLYYNQGCVQDPEHEMFTWAQSHVPQEMRQGLDYVWVSYYEQRCHGTEPDWNVVFARLHALFPRAKLGFGGCGTTDPADKAPLVRHFYGIDIELPSFVGGGFYWYFREDMTPSTAPLWMVLNDSLVRPTL
jgi:hypothetical protein